MRRFYLLLCPVLAACASGPSETLPVQETPAGQVAFDSYLWRAARETVDFLPITSADPLGGELVTGWGLAGGSDARTRYQVTIHLDYTKIYAQAATVTVARQELRGPGWIDVGADARAAAALAEVVAGTAGELRLAANPSN